MPSTVTLFLLLAASTAWAYYSDQRDDMMNSVISDSNSFSETILYSTRKQMAGKSSVQSAYSLLVPLGQLLMGACDTCNYIDSPTRGQITHILGGDDQFFPKTLARSSFNKHLMADTRVKLNMASRIYVSDKFDLNDEYVANTSKYFQSEPVKVDVSKNKETAAAINKWVADETDNLIKDFIDPNSIKPSDIAILVNNIYFKGMWEKPFEKEDTESSQFYVTEQDIVTLPIMNIQSRFEYAETDEAKILKLPFTGSESAMTIVLPNNKVNYLDRFLGQPVMEFLSHFNELKEEEVRVSIPKFKIETTSNLKNVLNNVRILDVFDPESSQLDNIIKGKTGISIGAAIRKAFIQINETGADAAAANALTMDGATQKTEKSILLGATRFNNTKDFTADHPFMFLIEVGGAFLFSGVFSGKD